MKMKVDREKVGLKLNILKTKIMASGLITSWEIDGKQCHTLFFWAPKSLRMVISVVEIKRLLLLGRKVMTNLDGILQSKDSTLPKKVPSAQAYGFSSSHVWM